MFFMKITVLLFQKGIKEASETDFDAVININQYKKYRK